MSKKSAFIRAVAFSQFELAALWDNCPAVPSIPRIPNPSENELLYVGRATIANALGFSTSQVHRLLAGHGDRGLQLRFDAFMEKLTEAFQEKHTAFQQTWKPKVPQKDKKPVRVKKESPSKRKTKKSKKDKKPVNTTALAVPNETPGSLVDASQVPMELERKMGWNLFQNISALSRASGVHRSVLIRMRDGLPVRMSSRDKVLSLVNLTTKTVVRRLRPPRDQ